MREVDPGHVYMLAHLDGSNESPLVFVKRVGERYPGNVAPAHEGTTTQEVIRALIARTKYVDGQIPSPHNGAVIDHLRTALWELELRAAKERGDNQVTLLATRATAEDHPVCLNCGHVGCSRTAEEHRLGGRGAGTAPLKGGEGR